MTLHELNQLRNNGGAACVRTFRHYIGIEMDAVYHARAIERVEREAAEKREQAEAMLRAGEDLIKRHAAVTDRTKESTERLDQLLKEFRDAVIGEAD